VLDPHRAHWSGSPRIGRIEFIGDPEPVRLASDLDKRGLDVVIPPSAPARVPGARSVPGWDIGYLALQTEKEPFRRKKARQAVAAGLEPRLISGAVGMEAIPLQSFLPAGVGGRREGSPIMLGSAESARRLLAEAGLQSRLSFTLLVGASPGSLPDPARVAQAIRTSLAPAGITVALQSEAKDTAVAVAQDGEHEAVLMEAPVTGGDPHLLLYPLSSSEATTKGRNAWNVSFYRNSHLDDLLIRGSQLSFPPERMRVYGRAQALLAEELPWIPIYVRLHWVVARPEVKNLRLHPSGGHRLDRVSLEAGGESPASQ
jgi:ABC-type transport system substrate-binding protein